jgi:DNA-binding SARP family transcriptional activator
VDFRLLGPLEVIDGGLTVPIGGPRQRTLLALLLLRRGEPVPSEQLIAELWGQHPPRTALTALQNHIARLRRSLGDARLVTRASGYAIALEPDELDLERFEGFVERSRVADPATRSALLVDALALWRGAPLGGLSDVAIIAAERSRLEELRLAALEGRIDADLELGREARLVVELSSLAVRHPRREGLSRRLMLALYRSGRQAEALDVYAETRRILAHELGLEPSESLRALHRAMLRHDPALEPRQPPIEPVVAPAHPASRSRRVRVALIATLVLAASASMAYTLAWPRAGSAARLAVPRGWSVHRDSFAESYPDPSTWNQIMSGSGSSEAIVHGHLELRFEPTARVGGRYAQVGGKLRTLCSFPGDFIAQVSFRLVRWPAANGVIVALWALGRGFASIDRVSERDPGDFYAGRVDHRDLCGRSWTTMPARSGWLDTKGASLPRSSRETSGSRS